ncbi:phage tail protein [Janthinobacterium sp. P210006]|uniref:phage tail protein n=1 Tax=Janthinobacterium sp. P210006 TaxID=3112939 RepID=UPI002E2688F5|nr:phage tail protein [Janthinobacterium sp. P210006]
MSTYFAILTEVGEAKLANAIALGQTLKLKSLAVGDGNGNLPMPERKQKALVREVRRAGLNQLTIDPTNTSQIIVEQVLPEDVGGWWIREIGIYDVAGDLCAVANCPPSYKPLMLEGSGRTQVVRIVLIVASTAAIELKIDPSIILATRKYVDDQDITVRAYSDEQLAKHLVATDPHPLLAKVAYVDQQDTSARAYGDQQLAKHQAAADPHPLLAKVAYVDQQDTSARAYGDQQLAKHQAAADPHPLLAKAAYVDQQDASARAYGDQQLAKHQAAADPHPLLAKAVYVDQQDASARAYGDQQLAKHQAAADPHPLLAKSAYVDQQDSNVAAYGDQQLAKHVAAADPHSQYSKKEVATLPKFNASSKLASAEFVQQAQGSMVKYVGVNADRTLTADDMGAALYFTAPGLTLTIPSPDSLGIPANSGKYFKLFGLNQSPGTIASGAGVVIGYDVGDVKRIIVKQGQFITVMATSSQVWQVIDATAEMGRNADFSSKLAASSGHQKLPGNFIMQFGDATATPGGNFIAFDIVFPVECFGVCLTGANSDAVNRLGTSKPSRTGFTAYSSDSTPATRYIAFGK